MRNQTVTQVNEALGNICTLLVATAIFLLILF